MKTTSTFPGRSTRIASALVAGLLLAAFAPRAAQALTPTAPATVPSQVLVKFQPGTSATLRSAAHTASGATVLNRIGRIGYDLVQVATVEGALRSYRANPTVELAEPNLTGSIAASPSDACHTSPCDGLQGQWHHLMTNTPFGWDLVPAAGAPVTIAVLDTKIDASHPDWVNAGASGPDVASGGQLVLADARDFVPANRHGGAALYHGTFVAGLAAAATGNGIDAVGTGYTARILPITVVDGNGMTDAATLAQAILYAHARGADIINLSLGINGDSQAVHDAIITVTQATVPSLIVAAAGNHTGSSAFYPGSYPEVMSVGGTDRNDRHASCANHNANISVSAPADRLIGIQHMPGRALQAPCGTSAATPQVSGLAALLLAQDPSRSPSELRSIIESSADDLGEPGRDNRFGHGRINVARALATGGAETDRVAATVVSSRGGTSTVTADAFALTGIHAAEVIIGRPDATPIALGAADGSFDGMTESLSASVQIPASLGAGPHPIWVRAHDGITWGPTSVGVLAIDGKAPTMWGEKTQDSMRALGQPLQVSFSVGDDYGTSFSHGIQIRSTATNAVVHTQTRYGTPGGAVSYQWLPPLDLPGGHYRIHIAIADEVGNVMMKELGALIT